MALIQTRVPVKIDKWVKQQAKKAGLSKAAWLRNHLVMMQVREAEIKKHVGGILDGVEQSPLVGGFSECHDCKKKSAVIVCLRCRKWLCTSCHSSPIHKHCEFLESVFTGNLDEESE